MLTDNIAKRQTISSYIKEAVAAKLRQDAEKVKEKEVYDAIKESEDCLGIELSEFKSAVAALYDSERVSNQIDKLQAGLDIIEELRVFRREVLDIVEED